MAVKTILVTIFEKSGSADETVYGKYNAVTRKRNGWSVKSQKLYKCTMTDQTFWNNSSHTEVT